MSISEPNAPVKVFRLNYLNKEAPDSPTISMIGGDRPAIRMAVDSKTFMSVTPQGIAMSPGTGNSFAIKGMSSNMVYGGMLQDLPFPMALLPTTPATPFPKQMIRLPFMGQFAQMGPALGLATTLIGV